MSTMSSGARFSFEVEGLLQAFHVARLEGREGISELYQFELGLTSQDADINFEDVVGSAALLTLHAEGSSRAVHGIISRFEQVGGGGGRAAYSATIVPHAFRLKLRQNCRVFQGMDAPAILTRVLEEAGLLGDDYRLALVRKEYRVREHCIQYRESDWSFVSRLMEEEGIFYFFEHRNDRHTLVIADSAYAHRAIPGPDTLAFRPPTGIVAPGDHAHRFSFAQELRASRVALRDYSFKNPALTLEATAGAAGEHGPIEVYDASPGSYEDPKSGAVVARIRLEEQQAAGRTGAVESGSIRVLPGYLFTMSEHPRESFNRQYLITRVEHRGAQPDVAEAAGSGAAEGYSNRFTCIPAEVPFRPAQRTPRPVFRGAQTAVVVGPPGEDIHTDEFGRVRVRFHWDRSSPRNEQSSAWIRVSQSWAGQGWGSLHIPRVGQEVVVDFLEGDLDRPLVTGAVYHGTNLTPYKLPAEKTKSTLRSSSSPGGDGYNELCFEDKRGEEEILLHGHRDLTIEVGRDKDQTVGRDESLGVARNRVKTVGVDQSERVGANKSIEVGANHTESIGLDESITVTGNSSQSVGIMRTEVIGANRSVMVGANNTEIIGMNMTISVGGRRAETIAADSTEKVGGDKEAAVDGRYDIVVGGGMLTRVGGDHTEEVDLEKMIAAGKKIELLCGTSRILVDKKGRIVVEGANIVLRSAGPVKVESKKLQVRSSGSVNVKAAGTVKVKGTIVGIN